MDEDFDEIFDELFGDEDGDRAPQPSWRATIRGCQLRLTTWAPWLARGGPMGALLAQRERAGIAIADLTVHGGDERELSVRFHVAGPDPHQAEQVLVDWAARVGYGRVWLPDRLVAIQPDPERFGTAAVRCSTCRARWSDSTPEFWLGVTKAGAFPLFCPLCGCEMPQWTVAGEATERPTRSERRRDPWRASDSRRRTRQEKT